MLVRNRFLLWFGAKHSGKTTAAAKLAQRACAEGFTVAGLLAPSAADATSDAFISELSEIGRFLLTPFIVDWSSPKLPE
jgi:signal recognition particle GTPase